MFYVLNIIEDKYVVNSKSPLVIINFLRNNLQLDGNTHYINLRDAELKSVNLSYLDMKGANMSRACFSNALLDNAYLSKCDLSEANFTEANLKDCRLENVSLHNTMGDGVRIQTLQANGIIINKYDDRLQIGRENYLKSEWRDLEDSYVDCMWNGSLKFWKEWKPKLISMGWL